MNEDLYTMAFLAPPLTLMLLFLSVCVWHEALVRRRRTVQKMLKVMGEENTQVQLEKKEVMRKVCKDSPVSPCVFCSALVPQGMLMCDECKCNRAGWSMFSRVQGEQWRWHSEVMHYSPSASAARRAQEDAMDKARKEFQKRHPQPFDCVFSTEVIVHQEFEPPPASAPSDVTVNERGEVFPTVPPSHIAIGKVKPWFSQPGSIHDDDTIQGDDADGACGLPLGRK